MDEEKSELDSPGTSACEFSHYARQLTPEEIELLKRQTSRSVAPFKERKLETEADRFWDKFYLRNETRFFKDRHWTKDEFRELCSDVDWERPMKLLEAGCGVGNLLFPFLETFPNIVHAYACDFSKRAVKLLQENPAFEKERCTAFVCDLTSSDGLSSHIEPGSIDLCTMIFVLSAVPVTKMSSVVKNLFQVMKPGGFILLRDYGLYDYAMLRFGPGHKLSDDSYFRQDGTRAYYFSEEKLSQLFIDAGFEVVSCRYKCSETVNRKENVCAARVFIQGRFSKPS